MTPLRCAVQPNYRGSTGYGEDSIQSLPGRAGTNDVADCMTALQAAIDQGKHTVKFACALCSKETLCSRKRGARRAQGQCTAWTGGSKYAACVAAGLADPKRVAAVGGSHGGFLAGHLVGQHPQVLLLLLLYAAGRLLASFTLPC
jgi:Prolyl oligopeptidase family